MAPSPWRPKLQPVLMLLFALSLYGIGEGMLVSSRLGATPWAVLAQGLSKQTGIGLGWTTFYISMAVLLLWPPLRLRPGLGTLLNMAVIAAVLGWFTTLLPAPGTLPIQLALCVGGIMLIGIAAVLYLTCHMGAGPRDGLMVGLCLQTGWRVGIVRSLLETAVCLIGWLLGGTFGIGTLLFAFGVGWVVQVALGLLQKLFAD